jgi:hypothetical protein
VPKPRAKRKVKKKAGKIKKVKVRPAVRFMPEVEKAKPKLVNAKQPVKSLPKSKQKGKAKPKKKAKFRPKKRTKKAKPKKKKPARFKQTLIPK